MTETTTGYFVEGITNGEYLAGPYFRESTARTGAKARDEPAQVMPDEVTFATHPTDFSDDLDDVYDDLDSRTLDERSIDVPLYHGDGDIAYDDRTTTLTLHVTLDGRRAIFWVDSLCDCCQTRPETTVSKDIGTSDAFRTAVTDFLDQVLTGTAPRRHPDDVPTLAHER